MYTTNFDPEALDCKNLHTKYGHFFAIVSHKLVQKHFLENTYQNAVVSAVIVTLPGIKMSPPTDV